MNRVCKGITVWGLLLSSTAIAVAKPIVHIQNWHTSNGAQVFFVSAPELPMVDVSVIFAAGSAYDGPQWGLSTATNSMLDEGTDKMSADQVAEAFDNVGAQYKANANRDFALVSLRSLTAPQYLTPALEMFAAVLQHPNFPESSYARVMNTILVAIQAGQQQPSVIAENKFYDLVFGKQPYGHPVMGTLDTVKQLTTQQIRDFYHRYYVASNANVVIVGALTRAQAEQVANKVVAGLPAGQMAPKLALSGDVSAGQNQHISYPAKQTSIVMGQVGINRYNPDYFPLIVGNYILGGAPLNSILFREVRDLRGLAYGTESDFNALRYRGPFAIRLQTKASGTDEALTVVKQVMQKFITQGPSAAELELAKKNLIMSFPLGIATNKELMMAVANIAFYNLPLNYLDMYRDKVDAVSTEKIKLSFKKTIHLDKMITVTVGPQATLTNGTSGTIGHDRRTQGRS